MSDETIKRSGRRLKKGSSGDHPIMKEVRAKLDSIREHQLPELEALNARSNAVLDRLKKDSLPPDEDEGENDEDIKLLPEHCEEQAREEKKKESS